MHLSAMNQTTKDAQMRCICLHLSGTVMSAQRCDASAHEFRALRPLRRCRRRAPAQVWVFRDVAFENNSLKPLTHISFRCEVPTASVFEGHYTIIIKPRILKHRIPELPTGAHRLRGQDRAALRRCHRLL